MSERPRGALPLLFSVVVVDLIGFGVVMPILPLYAREFGASGFEVGLLGTCYAAAQFAFAPFWGRLSDRFGRRRVLVSTISGTAVALLAFGLAGSIAALFAARTLAGLFAANIGVASAYITDVTDESERTRYMGLLGASFGVGFVVGPAIGGLLAPFGLAVPILVAAGLAGANAVYAFFVLQEPARRTERGERVGRLDVLRDPTVRRLCLTYFLFSVAVTQLETMFALFMADRFGYGAREVAFLFVGIAVVMGGIQGGGMRALSARFAERTLSVAGMALLAAAFASMVLAPTVAILLLPLTVSAVGRGIAQPPLMSLASFRAAADRRGIVLATFQSSASLARVVGPAAAGLLYDQSISGPFLLASGLMAGATVLALGLPTPDPDPDPDRV
ncbi:MAG: MFS transporter [Myxococcota bacterium]